MGYTSIQHEFKISQSQPFSALSIKQYAVKKCYQIEGLTKKKRHTCFLSSFLRAISAALSSLLIPVKFGVTGTGVECFLSISAQPSESGGGGEEIGVDCWLEAIDVPRLFVVATVNFWG